VVFKRVSWQFFRAPPSSSPLYVAAPRFRTAQAAKLLHNGRAGLDFAELGRKREQTVNPKLEKRCSPRKTPELGKNP
jgi:hypothetical protein